MIEQYLKYGIRSLKKDIKSTLFLILGWSIALVAVICIVYWTVDELTFNRQFSTSERTFQLAATFDKRANQFTYFSPAAIAIPAQESIPSVEHVCRVQKTYMTTFIQEGNHFNEGGLFADDSFFHIFDLPIESLDRNKPFATPRSVILTKSFAKKLFPEGNGLGKTILLELDWIKKLSKQPFTVSAIIDDFPENSSLSGNFILPFALLKQIKGEQYDTDWGNFQTSVFILSRDSKHASTIASELTKIQKLKFGTDDASQDHGVYANFAYYLQPIQNLQLYNPKGEQQGIRLVYAILALGAVILIISCANYINLITAKATKRSKEISLRKIIGASRKQLFLQYVTESSLIFIASLVLAMFCTQLVLPYFNELTDKTINIKLLSVANFFIAGSLFCLTVVLAGIYPAILFSTKKLAGLLKSETRSMGSPENVRKGLIVMQLTSTVILVTGTIILQQQLSFMRNKDLGYNKENVFLLEQKNFLPHYEAVREELERQPGILGVTAASSDLSNFGSETADIGWDGKTAAQTNFFITQVAIDRNFTDVMQIPLMEGSGFTGTEADSNYVLLNEKAIHEMQIVDPIGKSIEFRGKEMIIAGVMKDFNFNDLKTGIKPCAFFIGNGFALGGMYVKSRSDKVDQAISAVRSLWDRYNADQNFTYSFLDESFTKLYKQELISAKLVSILSLLAIFLSCIGLASLVIYTTELKVKEIGIRKTLGASVKSIILLITKGYMKLVFLSILIAFPISWILATSWLNNFVYRTGLDWWIFFVAWILVVIVAILTSAHISIKAAKANPTAALKN